MVEVNYLLKFDEGDIPYNKPPSQCLYEFDNYTMKQDHFNANVMKQLKYNSDMIARLSDLLIEFQMMLEVWESILLCSNSVRTSC